MSNIGPGPGKVTGHGEITKANATTPPPDLDVVKPEEPTKPEASVEKDEVANPSADSEVDEPEKEEKLEPKISDKSGFDPNIIQDGRFDNKESEGGVTRAKSTGVTGLSNSTSTPDGVIKPIVGDMPDMYELAGFTVSYKIEGTKDISSQEVRTFFNTIVEAKAAVDGKKYFHHLKDKMIEAEITRGMPCIAINDVMKCEYIDGAWRGV